MIEKALKKYREKYHGTGVFHPIKTSNIGDHLSCIRQKDVNIWFYRKHDQVIAVDSGYCDDANFSQNLKRLGIENDQISAVFLTHGDLENAGGVCSEEVFAPQAKIYCHSREIPLLQGRAKRLGSGLFKVKSPLHLSREVVECHDKQVIHLDTIEICCFHCPGHTPGHMVYLVDRKYLFTGDTIALNSEAGHCYFHELNQNTKENIQSLHRLQENLVGKEPEKVFTAHNGMGNYETAFSRVNQVAKGTRKSPFDSKAPVDVFTENA